MKKYSAIVCASALALALSACGGGDAPVDGNTSAAPPSETPATGNANGANGTVAAGNQPATQVPFGNAEVVTSPINDKVRSLPALTPSASVQSRINSTSSGRVDPFAGRVISVRPVPPDPQEVAVSFPLAGRNRSAASDLGSLVGGGSANGGSAGRSSGGSIASRGVGASTSSGRSGGSAGRSAGSSASTASTGGKTSGGGSTASGGGALPDLAARPSIPDPALARGVEVTGIVLVGSKYQAIVKAPDEPTSRYVTAGQRLSNGRVLVKRIENQGSEPVVVLEEDGVEVIRSIGAPAEGSSGNATAALPVLQPAS